MGSSVSEAKPVPADVPEATLLFEPRPSKLLVGLSVLVIAGCLSLVGASIGAMASTFDPCSFISGVILLPVPLFIAVQQYRGVFHRQTGAAFAAACCLVVFGALFVFGAVVNVLEFVFDNRRTGVDWSRDWPLFCILASIGLVGLTNVALGWRTIQWTRRLRAAGLPSLTRTFSLRELLAMIAVIGLVAGIARLTVDRRPSTGVNVPPDQAPVSVPATAKDVCYQNWGRGGYAVDFTTDEATLRTWIAEVAVPPWDRAEVKPLQRTAECVVRDYRDNAWIATDVLEYSWSFEGNGAVAVFDPATGRAYYRRYHD